tara:strand:- start:11120 stop:11368 length:249 start_codon:yes stop_codon:yes gene_type:complete
MPEDIKDQINNPLHQIKLIDILNYLIALYGFKKLGEKISIKCFTHNPSLKSSLTFLRKTPWARLKVEQLYFKSFKTNTLTKI